METTNVILLAVIAILVVAVIWNSIKSAKKKEKKEIPPPAPPKNRSDVRDLNHNDFNDVFIAGLAHHCTKRDVGCFAGWIVNEKNNPYDRNAMLIVNSSKKAIGYIPSAILKSFREWCDGKNCPCAGFIFIEDGQLRGRVRAYHPDRCTSDEYEKDVIWYLQNACERYSLELPSFARE